MDRTVLIIDDDKELCNLLRKCLENEGITAQLAYTGADGLKQGLDGNYHLIVLDVMLPEMNGFDVLSELRKTNPVPVLMLTAKDNELDKVSGLRLGADDYLTKPFSINEFVARTHSLIRRYTTLNNHHHSTERSLHFKGLNIDANNRTVEVGGIPVELTGKEFDLLYFLASHKGQVFTKKQIYRQVWNDDYAFDDNNVMAYMSKLRKKIEADADKPIYIQTVWGVGYRFSQEV
ncbi:response regulator transcription factor [Paenibacillus albiflavus]|uniref:Response regulator transcription factor n=1 Tax=Paenibacillus albiflavus TaxID=2545760 RepID=A0A4R4EKP6_9BACL|nr:response regulator transcription factor [Paenibacillus albiflavus]TCZ78865.1 response regulator transcription factor [Paenibacillus albiflavus]